MRGRSQRGKKKTDRTGYPRENTEKCLYISFVANSLMSLLLFDLLTVSTKGSCFIKQHPFAPPPHCPTPYANTTYGHGHLSHVRSQLVPLKAEADLSSAPWRASRPPTLLFLGHKLPLRQTERAGFPSPPQYPVSGGGGGKYLARGLALQLCSCLTWSLLQQTGGGIWLSLARGEVSLSSWSISL